tara:strand:+ start:324 stop:437 length:114 start_codon:yes stop_codon:yes gene_type:complete
MDTLADVVGAKFSYFDQVLYKAGILIKQVSPPNYIAN